MTNSGQRNIFRGKIKFCLNKGDKKQRAKLGEEKSLNKAKSICYMKGRGSQLALSCCLPKEVEKQKEQRPSGGQHNHESQER